MTKSSLWPLAVTKRNFTYGTEDVYLTFNFYINQSFRGASNAPTFLGNQAGATDARNAITSFMDSQQSLPVLNSHTYNSQPWGVTLTSYSLADGKYRSTQSGYDFRNPKWVSYGNLIEEPVDVNRFSTNSYEFAVYTFDRNVPAVPEPSGAAMLGLGLAGLALLCRKRQG